ncbi:MAG: hypothetical protein KME31_32440 [Tolypothrix carrinoi HA7290-LM1]|nr:hypothetical protein [Tolypothrix carrinoi HA7290-LM1]
MRLSSKAIAKVFGLLNLNIPKAFFSLVQQIYMQQHLEIHDTIQLKDGRIFDLIRSRNG